MPEVLLQKVTGGVSANGCREIRFSFSGSPDGYRARMFFRYDGRNDFVSDGTGVFAIPSDPCDSVSYDDWSGGLRRPFYDTRGLSHDSSFNFEVDLLFSGDPGEHSVEFVTDSGHSPRISGESFLDGEYGPENLPVNVLLERVVDSFAVERAEYDPERHAVVVRTEAPHGFSDGDSVTMSGFPRGDHSIGVSGERFNGTYRIARLSDTEFSYSIEFYLGLDGQRTEYSGYPGLTASRWGVCTYSRQCDCVPGTDETLVVWAGHTLCRDDRVTLAWETGEEVHDAVITGTAPNSFVCRTPAANPGLSSVTVYYAPRTPVSDVPANYGLQAPVPAKRSKKAMLRSAPAAQDPGVDNASRYVSVYDPVTPYMYGVFRRGSTDSVPVAGSDLAVGGGAFSAVTFVPPRPGSDTLDGHMLVSFRVSASTEVSTELCVHCMSDSGWTPYSSPDEVYGKVAVDPIARVDVSTKAVAEGGDWSCDFANLTPEFTVTVPGGIASRWARSSQAVSLAFVLYGRDGAEVTIPRSSVTVKYVARESGETPDTVAITVRPGIVDAGGIVTVRSEEAGAFFGPVEDYEVRLGDLPGITPLTNDGTSLTVALPEGFSGTATLKVRWLDRTTGTWYDRSEGASVDVRRTVPRKVTLSDGGLSPRGVDPSTSAAYNRDLGFKGFAEITDENSMIQNLYSCLLTRKGERLFNPEFGTTLEERVFAIRSGVGQDAILKECMAAIETYEPRIRLVYEQCSVEDRGPHGIAIVLGVIVPGGNVRMVEIPFKNRGVMV